MAQLSPKIFLVVETTEYEGDPFLSLLIRMINKVIGFSCIRFTVIFPASNFNTCFRLLAPEDGNEDELLYLH